MVDNTWIALWFATHQSKSIIADNREYIHLFENTESPYAFLLLIGSDALKEDPIHPGYIPDQQLFKSIYEKQFHLISFDLMRSMLLC